MPLHNSTFLIYQFNHLHLSINQYIAQTYSFTYPCNRCCKVMIFFGLIKFFYNYMRQAVVLTSGHSDNQKSQKSGNPIIPICFFSVSPYKHFPTLLPHLTASYRFLRHPTSFYRFLPIRGPLSDIWTDNDRITYGELSDNGGDNVSDAIFTEIQYMRFFLYLCKF